MKALIYSDGDITAPISTGPLIVAHVCNNFGLWRGSASELIARRWPNAKRAYRQWYRGRVKNDFGLGAVQFVAATRTHINRVVRIANMVAQSGTRRPIQYRNFRKCLIAVAEKAQKIGASVHLPKIHPPQTDCWPDLEKIIVDVFCLDNIDVTLYVPSPELTDQMFGEVFQKKRTRFEIA